MTRNQSGFALVDVVIACGLLAIALAVAASASFYGMKTWKSSQEKNSIAGKTNELKNALAVRQICESNFKGLEVGLSPLKAPSVAQVDYYADDGSASGTILKTGSAEYGFLAADIKISPRVELANGKILAELEVRSNANDGNSSMRRSTPLLLDMNAGKIESCVAGVDNEVELKQKSCPIGSDGVYVWSDAENACIDRREWKDFFGAVDTSSCGSGFNLEMCWSQAPADWVDPMTGAPRTYADGTVDNRPPDVALCSADWDTNSCSCEYATDISTDGFQTVATCYR